MARMIGHNKIWSIWMVVVCVQERFVLTLSVSVRIKTRSRFEVVVLCKCGIGPEKVGRRAQRKIV